LHRQRREDDAEKPRQHDIAGDAEQAAELLRRQECGRWLDLKAAASQ
jgi:hypothetical protein